MASERTKKHIAEKFANLVLKVPFKEITISDLCRFCDIDRRTFYYHFRDKYDLMLWKQHNDWYNALKAHENESVRDRFSHCLNEVYLSQREYYQRILQYKGQNSMLQAWISETINNHTEALLRSYPNLMIDDELRWGILYHSSATAMSIYCWIIMDSPLSAEQLTRIIYDNMSTILSTLDINQTFEERMKKNRQP